MSIIDDILEGDVFVALYDKGNSIAVLWNRSATFSVINTERQTEIDIFTVNDVASGAEATRHAREWVKENKEYIYEAS